MNIAIIIIIIIIIMSTFVTCNLNSPQHALYLKIIGKEFPDLL